jgi:hypothetical protein
MDFWFAGPHGESNHVPFDWLYWLYKVTSFGASLESMSTEDGSTGFSMGVQLYWLWVGNPATKLTN